METKIDIKAEGTLAANLTPEEATRKIRDLLSGHFTLSYLRGQGINLTALSVTVVSKN